MNMDNLKQQAAAQAVARVENHMRLGLGTGSTAAHFVRLLGQRIAREGISVVGVPTSEATRLLAIECGVPLTTLDETPELDLTIDGADELDNSLQLIKGGGGALLREKIVAAASRQMIVIADDSKHVSQLGAFPLPIEVIRFGLEATKRAILKVLEQQGCACSLVLRLTGDKPFLTDEGHYILDAPCQSIPDAVALAHALKTVPGVVEHGLFLGLATGALLAGGNGVKTIL